MEKLYYKKYHLDNELEQYVKYIWVMKSQEVESKQDLLIPDGYAEIIFVLKGAYQKEYLNQKKRQSIGQSCIVGIQTQSVLASRINYCHLVGVKLNPVGAFVLFGDYLSKSKTINVSIDKLGDDGLSKLDESLKACGQEEKIIQLLTTYLQNRLIHLEQNPQITQAAVYLNSILSSNGNTSIPELAKKHNISVRQFQRNFKRFFGITPKKFLNIIRFKQFYKTSILQQKLPDNYLDFGYYDQMHFIKDFQKNLGVNPSKSANEVFIKMNEMARMNK